MRSELISDAFSIIGLSMCHLLGVGMSPFRNLRCRVLGVSAPSIALAPLHLFDDSKSNFDPEETVTAPALAASKSAIDGTGTEFP